MLVGRPNDLSGGLWMQTVRIRGYVIRRRE